MVFLADNKGKHPEELYLMPDKRSKKGTLGTGAFGEVVKATNRKTKQLAAIKTIPKGKNNLAVLKNEIDINMSMDNPNIVRIYETFQDYENIYLAMEICDGGEMFDLIIDAGNFNEDHASILMRQICRGVYYMHDHGVAHRDLKPENFLLTKKCIEKDPRNGVPLDRNELKIIDFGIAKRFNPRIPDPTRFREKVGTAYYIAPEVILGEYDEKCDIWSCGVILYILLSGSPPFPGETDREIFAAIKKGRIDFRKEDFGHVSSQAKILIQKCCKTPAETRYSAKQAANDEWINHVRDLSRAPVNAEEASKLVSKFKAFSSISRFKKAALHIIAHHVNDDSIKKLRQQFAALDKDGNGELTLQELKAGAGGILGKEDDLQKLFETIDSDHNGSISYSEFLAATMDRKSLMQRQNYWEAFRVFDLDGNGRITKKEFDQIMKDDGTREFAGAVNAQEMSQMFKEADTDGDGEIDFDEFCAMMDK